MALHSQHNKPAQPGPVRSGRPERRSRLSAWVQTGPSIFDAEAARRKRSEPSDTDIEVPPGRENTIRDSGSAKDSDLLIYSSNGLLVVHSNAGHWVVPPTTVLRLLPGTEYSVRKAEQVSVRIVTLPGSFGQRLPSGNCLYRLTPLLRELLESMSAHAAVDRDSHDSKVVLLAELLNEAGTWGTKAMHQCRRVPKDARVAHICDYINNNLDAPKTLQEWATELKIDTRTLHRLFVQEFGVSFVQWRQQARLMAAFEWLAEGRQVMDVALDLGYQTQSAFAAMFRRNMGITPSEWQEKQRSNRVRTDYMIT